MQTAAVRAVGLCPVRLQRAVQLCRRYVDEGVKPCSQLLVARHGEIVVDDMYGWADLASGRTIEAGDNPMFRIYSMTKPLTCAAAMVLYERGCFQLGDPVARWIPEWGKVRVMRGGTADAPETIPAERPVTVLHLFTHTGGIVQAIPGVSEDVPLAELWRRTMNSPPSRDLAHLAERAAQVPLVCQPGTEFHYGDGHSVLARLVEIWSGQPFDAFVESAITGPLGMRDTSFRVPQAKRSRLVKMYAKGPKGGLVPSAETQFSFLTDRMMDGDCALSGSYGLCSTARDYFRFAQMLLNGGELHGQRVLSPLTVDLLTANHLPGGCDLAAMGLSSFAETPMEGVGFGLGMAVGLGGVRRALLSSPGEYFWGGIASTFFWVDPVEDIVVVHMSQLCPSGTTPIRQDLRILVNQAVVQPAASRHPPAVRRLRANRGPGGRRRARL
eukprot:TRINITY_DN12271_c0_g1_i1.p1 TRINITY_DN12271_c0_g1~~TRINITY_DN12271_c0_g1_i1.p1  ORF type:complete len:468 (+),score=96.96 TRINITY_DN12271_c0_g1_i1:83-1405(+)